MKKITLVLFAMLITAGFLPAQTTAIVKSPKQNGTTQVRAPNGLAAYAYQRACALVLASELTNIAPNTLLTTFGFTLSLNGGVVMTAPVTGNFTVYLENTSDVTFTKNTNWPTTIATMTNVYASVMTIPVATSVASVVVTLSTPFLYTGGGLYVAHDWASAGPFSAAANPATYLAEYTGLTPGCYSAFSAALPVPTALTGTNFRPCYLFGFANPNTNDIEVVRIEAPGKVNTGFNLPHTIKTTIRNASNQAQNNITVNLNITGANPLATNQVIPTLAAGASTVLNFPYKPQILGANTLSVSVGSDQNNANNTATFAQSVTCGTFAQNPAAGNYSIGVGLTAAGMVVAPYNNSVSSKMIGINGAISTDAASVGNQVYGVLLSGAGAVLAASTPITLSNAQLGTIVSFTFNTPQNLTPNTNYYIGIGQTAGGYLPAGTLPEPALPVQYYIAGPTGGVLTPLTPPIEAYFGIEGVFDPGTPVASASQTINCGSTATLTTQGAGTFSWSTGATTSNISVMPLVNTSYSVNTTSIGCPSWSLHTISVTPFSLSISASSQTLCAYSNLSLTGSGANSYTWNTPGGIKTGSSIAETPSVSTNYLVSGSNPDGCTSNNNIFITVDPLPVLNINSTIPTICLGGTVFMTATGNSTAYVWSHGPATATSVVAPTSSIVYSVIGTSSQGCTALKSLSVTVNSFTPGISSPTTICNGQQIVLSASGGVTGSYSWSGFNFQSITVNPTVTTSYSVTAKDVNGCSGNASTTVYVEAVPSVTASVQRATMCRGEQNVLTVTGTGATSYSWSTGATSTLVVITPTSNITYIYTAVGTSSAGCTHSAQVSVKVNLCTGIAEAGNGTVEVSIFPNPNNGLMTLRLGSAEKDASVAIYDALGKKISEQKLVGQDTTIDLLDVPKGLYFIHILSEDKTLQISKIIKN